MSNETGRHDEGSACGCGGGKWIWIGLAVAVLAVLLLKNPRPCGCASSAPPEKAVPAVMGLATNTPAQVVSAVKVESEKALPRLVDLGATKCIPCKMMAPILEDLKKTYAGKMDVQFIDVWENPDAGDPYGIKVIPTQVFYDAAGKELFRHEGFFAREDILAKWKEFGVDLNR